MHTEEAHKNLLRFICLDLREDLGPVGCQIGWPVAIPIRCSHVVTPDWKCHWPANLTLEPQVCKAVQEEFSYRFEYIYTSIYNIYIYIYI